MSKQRQKASVILKLCGVSQGRLPRAHQTARTCQTLCLDPPKRIAVGPERRLQNPNSVLPTGTHRALFCGRLLMYVLDVWACKYHRGSGTSPFTQNSSVPLPLTSQLEKVGPLVVTVEEEQLRSGSRNFNGGVEDHCRERMTLGFGRPCRN